ncbi:MAG: 3-deoxy-7-phosphoheptulonate synthase [Bdellovibrionales bacterium]|nr:3-deoxy-7-phosphoheptulonate synthase [Bdellovibrionales bacterium]
MIIHMEKSHTENQLHRLKEKIESHDCKPHVIFGETLVTISVIGEVSKISLREIESLDGVAFVTRVSKPFKLCSIETQRDDHKVRVGDLEIGGNSFVTMAGPCSIESEEQTLRIAHAVKKAGAKILRGGAFKPRSSPYSFQGLGEEGLKIMKLAQEETGLLTVSEAMDLHGLELCYKYVDIIQIGARNMQNFSLLKELGKIDKPIVLKRGMSATIEEWLMSAEYILSGGNDKVILCERGIRAFDNQYARNVLDLNVIPILKKLTYLPLIVDPSHGTGYRHMVSPLSRASIAAGAQGIIVEVHDRPEEALSDGPQALLPEEFSGLMKDLRKISEALDIRFISDDVEKKKVA